MFTQKKLNISFTMETGTFGASGSNTGTLSSGPASGNANTLGGLRITSQIVNAGGDSPGQMECAVYGMTLDQMNQLATVGTQITLQGKNQVTLEAGDENGMSTVFQGTISMAFFDGQGMPEVCFRVQAFAGQDERVTPQESTSIDGSGDVKTMLQSVAKKMNLTLEDNPVLSGIKLASHYASGSGLDQFKDICRAAGLEWTLENKVLAAWKPGTARPSTGGEYLIAPETGMVGYPAFNQAQVIVKQLWRPGVKRGSKVTIKSQITPACGDWTVNRIDYELDANVPNGRWFQTMYVSNLDIAPNAAAST